MIPIFGFNPFIGLQASALFITMYVVAFVLGVHEWWPSLIKASNKVISLSALGVEAAIWGLYGFLGIFCLDIALTWTIGAWTYADWRFHLPTVILLWAIGGFFMRRTYFARFRWSEMAVFGGLFMGYFIFVHFIVAREPIMGNVLIPRLPILLGGCVILSGLTHLISMIQETRVPPTSRFHPWIQSRGSALEGKPSRILTVFTLGAWLLITIQAMLFYSGNSLMDLGGL